MKRSLSVLFLLLICAGAHAWTDDLSVPGANKVKAKHLQEVREAADRVRAACGLSALDWTKPAYKSATLPKEEGPLMSQHVHALRAAIIQTYRDKEEPTALVPVSGLPGAPLSNSVWQSSDIQPSAPVDAYQIQDMRLALDHLETTACAPAPAPVPGCAPGECDSRKLGTTTGGICGCNVEGDTVDTIGPECKRYRCTKGEWKLIGAPSPCTMVATCT